MTAVSELREKSDVAWNKIKKLSKKYDELNSEERDLVVSYINEYEHFCTLYNEGIVNKSLVKKTRKDTILYVQDNYWGFIDSWRKDQSKPEAWKQLEICAKNLR